MCSSELPCRVTGPGSAAPSSVRPRRSSSAEARTPSYARAGQAFARSDRHRESVCGRRERTRPAGVIAARGLVGVVEIQDQETILLTQIRSLDRVKHVAPRSVGLASTRVVRKGKEQASSIAVEPIQIEGLRGCADRKLSAAEARKRHRSWAAARRLGAANRGARPAPPRENQSSIRTLVLQVLEPPPRSTPGPLPRKLRA